MKHQKLVPSLSLILSAAFAAHAQFTSGNLVVLRDGSGSSALSSGGTAIYLDQYTTAGSLVNSLSIPSSGSSALVNSGSASSEGTLNRSADGQYLVLAGYNTSAGYSKVASSASSTVARGVATVDASGNYTLAGTTSSYFSANNVRSATSDGNGNFWAVGANSGVVSMGTGTAVSTTSVNNRAIQEAGGNLYFSVATGTTRGIYAISGAPTSGSSTASAFITTSASASPFDFAFNSDLSVAYIADTDAYTGSTGIGGVEKWTLSDGAWSFDYSLSLGTNGAAGLAVNFSSSNPTVYATSADGNSLFAVTDTGSDATGTLLASASSNEAFRGLDFSPVAVPEPSTIAVAGLGLIALFGAGKQKRF